MQASNELYPIFLKPDQLRLLIVGGGTVALEKLGFLLKSSPGAKVELVSTEFDTTVVELAGKYNVPLYRKPYSATDLLGRNIVIGATNDQVVNQVIYQDAKAAGVLVNIADSPAQCDFYLGGIVTKGDLKVAISTNGKSPTMAKRLRAFFEEVIPEDINELLNNLHVYRSTLKGDFKTKVDLLNAATKQLINNN